MKTLCAYALSFVGIPYMWGGDDPMKGFDCSGLVQEILDSVGIDPPGDQTSQGLFDKFSMGGTKLDKPQAGALVFYGKGPSKITHIAFCIDDKRIVEAGGGRSSTTSEEIAAAQNAYVRVRRYDRRRDIVGIYMPNYGERVDPKEGGS